MLQCLDRPHRLAYVLGELMDFSGPEGFAASMASSISRCSSALNLPSSTPIARVVFAAEPA